MPVDSGETGHDSFSPPKKVALMCGRMRMTVQSSEGNGMKGVKSHAVINKYQTYGAG